MDLELIVNAFKGPIIWLAIISYIALIWLALSLYAWFDIRERTTNRAFRLVYTLLVGVGGVFGLLIYLIIRPRLTLAESAQKRLEEKFLVKESIELFCPNCGFVLEKDYLFCPNCSQNLKKLCLSCHKMSQISTPFCPFCAAKESRIMGPLELASVGILKRPRGRPRKLLSAPIEPKRPRGRPRKYPVIYDVTPKRPRGRPRKFGAVIDIPEPSPLLGRIAQEEEIDIPLN